MVKRKIFILLTCVFMVSVSTAQQVERIVQGIRVDGKDISLQVTFYSPTIVQVTKVPKGNSYTKESLVVTKVSEKAKVSIVNKGDVVELTSAALRVRVNTNNGEIDFLTKKGESLLRDKGDKSTYIKKEGVKGEFRAKNSFLLDQDEPIYGIGQVMDGKLNRRNAKHHLQNENMFTYSPYFTSLKGYAVYMDNYSIADFNDQPGDLSFETWGDCIAYYFMYGGNTDGVIAQVRDLTGGAPMLPLWSYGFFQSKERYHSQQEGLDVLKKFRQLQIPIDCIIQDWRYWPEYKKTDSAWNSQSFDKERFPDPKKWIDEIHALNAKLLIVTWPGFGPKTAQRQELDQKDMIINFNTWPPNSGARPYDVFNPKALDIYWSYLDKGIFGYINNDGWWLDSTEPDHIDRKDEDYDLPTHLGPYKYVKNAYSLMHNSGIATHQKNKSKDKRVVILTRSGFIGQQRYGSNTWSGDVASTWDMLEKQIPAALNYTMMGIPNWNSDIGGFFAGRWRNGGGAKNPEYQELYIRWMQFGAFSPMMRSHGTDVPREIWNFGERGEWCFDAQEKMINLRYRLLPYIYSTSWDVSSNNGTFMRALPMDYPTDSATYDLGGQYSFGRSILVCPVTKPNVDTWSVYLPKGEVWWDFWTNEKHNGGKKMDAKVSKDILPLYVKAGSIVPFGPKVQYSTEKKWDNLEIRIYPGKDGSFSLYEDEYDNYNYESGQYATIAFHWDDSKRQLTISNREGKYTGMLVERSFHIVVVDGSTASGDMAANGQHKVVKYNGKKTSVIFR